MLIQLNRQKLWFNQLLNAICFVFIAVVSIPTFSSESEISHSYKIHNTSIERTARNGIITEVFLPLNKKTDVLENSKPSLRIIDQKTGDKLPSIIERSHKSAAQTTLIIIPNNDLDQQQQTLNIIKKLINLRPKNELIGLYIFQQRLHLVANATSNRSKLLQALKKLRRIQLINNVAPSSYNFYDFKKIATLDSGENDYFRNAFIFGNEKLSSQLAKKLNQSISWPAVAVDPKQGKDPANIAESISKQIEFYLEIPFYRIAFCEPPSNTPVAIEFNGFIRPIQINRRLQKNSSRCELKSILSDHSYIPSKIYFEFNEQQQHKFERIVRKKSRTDFSLSVKSSNNGIKHPAIAHLRGQSSLRLCERKSYSLELTEHFPKNLIPHSSNHHYFLMALCFDPMSMRSHTAYELWQSLDLFPMRYRFIELFINNDSQGLYMILENPSKALIQKYSHISSIIRRNFDSFLIATHPNIKYSSTTKTQALGDYINAFLDIDKLPEKQLIKTLEKAIDLEQYITHLATSKILRNGDFVDELLFIRQESLMDDGSFIDRYQISKWDPDELFRPCHIAGKVALKDPWELAYCVESEIGKAILNQPALYDRFVNKIEELLSDKLSEEKVSSALDKTSKLIIHSLQSKGALLNIYNPEIRAQNPLTAEETAKLVRKEARNILKNYNQQRRSTLSKIKKYRKHQYHNKSL